MCKSISSLYLLLALLYIRFEAGIASKESASSIADTRIPYFDCPKGAPLSVCFKRWATLPLPTTGREVQARQQRSFGLVKYPRVGRSDPQLVLDKDDEIWPRANLHFTGDTHSRRVPDGSINLRRRDAPWAFFLITPNFQEQSTGNGVNSQFRPNDEELDVE